MNYHIATRAMRSRGLSAIATLAMLGVSMQYPFAQSNIPAALNAVDPELMISAAEADHWFEQKDAWGPTFMGSPAWLSYMALVEDELVGMGAADITKVRFSYPRWHTTEYPDTSGWSLTSDGKPVKVASYTYLSGSTGPDGVTAPTILYDLSLLEAERPTLEEIAGKIVVIKQPPFTGGEDDQTYNDYEYLSTPETFLEPGALVEPSYDGGFRNRHEFEVTDAIIEDVLSQSEAVGHVIVLNVPFGAAAGGQVSNRLMFDVPGVILDQEQGAVVIEDARAGKTATLVLDAHVEADSTAFQLVAWLPGKDYGTDADRAVMLTTHTDGPSLVQDSGAFGIVATMEYFSRIPQADRPMSILAFFDGQHFTPLPEDSSHDYLEHNLVALGRVVVGGVAVEHLGGAQMHDEGDQYVPTGNAMATIIHTYGNDMLVQAAIDAIDHSGLERAIVSVGGRGTALARPGINGGVQGRWRGPAPIATVISGAVPLPSWHLTGDWPTSGYQAIAGGGLDRYDGQAFLDQVETIVSLVQTLMTGDLVALNPVWGNLAITMDTLKDEGFLQPASATGQRDTLGSQVDAIVESVKAGDHAGAEAALAALSDDVAAQLTGDEATRMGGLIMAAHEQLAL